jgi:endogenous inhibitor of DNA gyrase (YacG/DUF329 family)
MPDRTHECVNWWGFFGGWMAKAKCPICDHDFDPKHSGACGTFCSSRCASVDQMYTDQGIYRVCFSCDVLFRALERHHRLCQECAQALTRDPKACGFSSTRDIDGRIIRRE